MTARRALQLFAAIVILWALADGTFAFFGRDHLPGLMLVGFDALAGLALLLWYQCDAASRGTEPSRLMGGAIVVLWVLAVPLYLLWSRPGGAKWRSLLASIGAGVLFWIALLVANAPAMLRHAR